MNFRKEGSSTKSSNRLPVPDAGVIVRLVACILLCSFPATAQSQRTPNPPGSSAQKPAPQSTGSISGTVVDQSGAFVSDVRVVLTRPDQSSSQETQTDINGRFSFTNVAPGAFQLSISAVSFNTQVATGTVRAGEAYVVPQISMAVATQVTEVHVDARQQVEIAEEQIKAQETQRVLGFIPNFYVSYVADAAPLNAKQKFELAWKSSTDPITFVSVAGLAGIQQATNEYKGYGQGAEGYGKRFGAAYADVVDGTMLGSVVFPTLLKQDPRYFYRGTGSTHSRLLYALSNAVMCKGDNKKWQPNYSNVLGNLAAGGIANLYYPASDRGAGLTFETAGIRIAETALVGVFQEFIVRKLTTNVPARNTTQP